MNRIQNFSIANKRLNFFSFVQDFAKNALDCAANHIQLTEQTIQIDYTSQGDPKYILNMCKCIR